MIYKYVTDRFTGENHTNCIKRINDDGSQSTIPFDPANTDYQEYLEWAKTNTAEPADQLDKTKKIYYTINVSEILVDLGQRYFPVVGEVCWW